MKLILLACVITVCFSEASANELGGENPITLEEDGMYWERLLQNNMMSVEAPSPRPPSGQPPTPRPPPVEPTEAPPTGAPPVALTPAPIAPSPAPVVPTPAPVEPSPAPVASTCFVELDIECAVADGRTCEEGLVMSTEPQEVAVNYTITNIGEVTALLHNITTNFTFEANTFFAIVTLTGWTLEPGETYEYNFPFANVTIADQELSVLVESLATASNEGGSVCSDFDKESFNFGDFAAGPSPTSAVVNPPTPRPPTSLDIPTPEPPEAGECEIELDIACVVADGRTCEEGLVMTTEPQAVAVNYTITNIGEVTAFPQNITTNFTFEENTFFATIRFSGETLVPGETVQFNFPFANVTIADDELVVLMEALATAANMEGSLCTTFDESAFDFGDFATGPSPTSAVVGPPSPRPPGGMDSNDCSNPMSCDICPQGSIDDLNTLVTALAPGVGTRTATCTDWFTFVCALITSGSNECSEVQVAVSDCCATRRNLRAKKM